MKRKHDDDADDFDARFEMLRMRALAAGPPAARVREGVSVVHHVLERAAARAPALERCDELLSATLALWRAIRSEHPSPEAFEIETLNLLLRASGKGRGVLSWTAAVREPLIVFHCPPRLFLCPALCEILLQVLCTLLAASSAAVDLALPPRTATSASLAARADPGGGATAAASTAHPMMRILLQEVITASCLLSLLDRDMVGGRAPPRVRQHVVAFLRARFRESPAVVMLVLQKAARKHVPWVLEAAADRCVT